MSQINYTLTNYAEHTEQFSQDMANRYLAGDEIRPRLVWENVERRKSRIVRNHIGCAILVWVRLKQVAHDTQRIIYRVKHALLDDYLRQQLKSPAIQMRLAKATVLLVKLGLR